MNYAEQLKHPLWQRRRLQILERADFHCARCGSGDKQLHAHHKVYFRGRMAWDYPDSLMECLCDECHDMAHAVKDRIDLEVAQHSTAELPALARLFVRLGDALQAENYHERVTALNAVNDELDAIEDFKRGPGGEA